MPKSNSIATNFTTGEISTLALGRFDLAKYNNAVKKMENFLINQLGGASYRPGTRYVAETKDSSKSSRVLPFQYSSDQDYVIEAGDEYMKFYSNDSEAVNRTTSPDKLLCNFNGVDGSYEIQDSGNTGHIVTKVGTAQTSTAQKKLGLTSLLLDGDSDYLTIPDHADWNIGTGDFTIEFFIMWNNTGASDPHIMCQGNAAGSDFWRLLRDVATNRLYLDVYYSAAYQLRAYINWTPSTGQWYHVAIVRSGANINMYIDGVSQSVTISSGSVGADIHDIAEPLYIGFSKITGTIDYVNGYLDEIRISNVARTITVPTSAYTSDANTKLLLHMDSLDVASGNALTFSGTAQIDTAQKKFGSASLLLDGNSDYISIPDSSDWDVTADDTDFTIDLWVKHTDHVGTEVYICQTEDANNNWILEHIHGTGVKFLMTSGGVEKIAVTAGEITDTNWHHVAMVKKSSTYTLYLDGVGGTPVTDADVDTFSGSLYIGQFNSSNYFDGWIDDARITKGYARYTADFTVPSAEATPETVITSEISAPYAEEDIFDIHTAQSNDVMYMVHPDYAPRKLSRTDATTFTISEVDFIRGPFLDDNTTTTTITPSSATGSTELTASTGIFDALHVGSLWRVKSAVVKIDTYVSATHVHGTVQAEPSGVAGNIGGTSAYTDWAEGAFSAYRGYPSTVAFHEQRLWYAATSYEPQKFWGSVIGAYDNFNPDDASDDDAVTFEIATEQRNKIQWLSSGNKGLVLGTTGGTFSAYTGSTAEAITPSNILVTRDTNYGVANLPPKRISSFLYYTQRDLNKIRELKYSFEADAQVSGDMTLLADHILRDGSGVVDIDHQQSPNDRIYCVLDDGTLAVLTRNPEQDVMGWSRFITDGSFESVCVIPKQNADDQVWIVVKRVINGSTKRFIEYFTSEQFTDDWDAVRVDCSLTLDNPKTITAITNANPGVLTIATHGLTTGDQVKINDVTGMVIDGIYTIVEGVDANHLTLKTLAGVAVDTTLLGTYLSGGELRKMVTSISGLSHLEGETVSVQVDGYIPTTETYTVSGGAITLSDKSAVVHVGLSYDGTLQLLKQSDGSAEGTGQTKNRRTYLSTLRVDRTQGLSIGRDESNLDDLVYEDNSLYTGDIEKMFPTSWGLQDELIIKQTKPIPANLLCIILRNETQD